MAKKIDTVADWVRESLVLEITAFGGTALYVVLVFFLLLIGKTEHVFIIITAYITSLPLAALIRVVYFKPRPEQREFTTLFGKLLASAFPSLHVMRAFTYAVIFADWVGSTMALGVFLSIAALVAWSRISLKKHDWVDVGVGAVMGVALGAALVRLLPV